MWNELQRNSTQCSCWKSQLQHLPIPVRNLNNLKCDSNHLHPCVVLNSYTSYPKCSKHKMCSPHLLNVTADMRTILPTAKTRATPTGAFECDFFQHHSIAFFPSVMLHRILPLTNVYLHCVQTEILLSPSLL